MRAVWLTKFGDPSVLVPGEAPDPVPGPGQVLIEVTHANITFVETQFRATGAGPFRAEAPLIPGNGVGGTVAALGPGADPGLLGRRVVSGTGGSGGYAELAAVPADGLFAVPDGLPLDQAVALLADGRTAVMQLRAADPRPGERALVLAAGGGVGSLLVQLAAAAGATVVAAAGSAEKLALARELGAAHTIDYREVDWADRARAEPGGVDVVFDGVGGAIGRAAFDLLRPGGRLDSYGLASGEWTAITEETATARGVRLVGADRSPHALRTATEHALTEAAAGRLRPVIGRRFPLAGAAAAHAAIEARDTLGKTLLETGR
ncbi:zinc-binding dehydrogenase [Kitasatospora sp. LaBMicrA B282]|uniref:zinc-binding dehydrogenase n=1 Tax=Kitasatospora sp. LaBMicrA B282 TaxID=3420949 RepID=UPI003D0E58A8